MQTITVSRCQENGVIVTLEIPKLMSDTQIETFGKEFFEQAEGQPYVILNLGKTKFLSSAAYNALLIADKKVKAAGGQRLVIVGIGDNILGELAQPRLDKTFDCHRESLETYLATKYPAVA